MKKQMTKGEMMKHNISRVLLMGALVATPVAVFAQQLSPTQNVSQLATRIISLFNIAVYAIIALAIVTFTWNVYRYFFKADPENKKDAGLYVMYSVIGFFVILAFWGLVNIVGNTFNLNNTAPNLNFFGTSAYNNGAFGGNSSSFSGALPVQSGQSSGLPVQSSSNSALPVQSGQ